MMTIITETRSLDSTGHKKEWRRNHEHPLQRNRQ